MRTIATALSLAILALGPNFANAAEIRGEYVEARTADVFTGPCFSNAEIFITGKNAVMAWKVTEGSWKGVKLDDLCVAAAVVGSTTFSEDQPEKAQSVLIVDSKATAKQREALVDLAKTLGGARLCHVANVTTARMVLKLEDHSASEAIRLTPHIPCPRPPARPSGRLVWLRSSLVRSTSGTMPAATKSSRILRSRPAWRPSPLILWDTPSKVTGSIPSGPIRTAGAASSATSPFDRLRRIRLGTQTRSRKRPLPFPSSELMCLSDGELSETAKVTAS